MSVATVLRYWWVVLLSTLAALGAALALALSRTPEYTSSGTFIVAPASQLAQPDAIVRSFESLKGPGVVPTFVELLSSGSAARSAGTAAGLDEQGVEAYRSVATVLSESHAVELSVTGPDPAIATEMVGRIATEATAVFTDLYPVYQVRPVDRPDPPDEPGGASPLRVAVLAAGLGFTGGVGTSVMLERHRRGRASGPVAGAGLERHASNAA